MRKEQVVFTDELSQKPTSKNVISVKLSNLDAVMEWDGENSNIRVEAERLAARQYNLLNKKLKELSDHIAQVILPL